MIRKHSLLASVDIAEFSYAINKQRNPRKSLIKQHEAVVKNAINDYRANLALGSVTPIGLAREYEEAYISLYDSKSPEVKLIKLNSQKGSYHEKCFYCAIDSYSDLDHYFPRSIFPEFSISSQNLIPSCTTCNRDLKGILWGNGVQRDFFHPYFDDLPDSKFLLCHINIIRGYLVISFSIENNIPGVLEESIALIQRHFIRFNLNDRYVSIICSQQIERMQNLKEKCNSRDEKIEKLTSWVSMNINCHRVNSPERSFYEALQGRIEEYC